MMLSTYSSEQLQLSDHTEFLQTFSTIGGYNNLEKSTVVPVVPASEGVFNPFKGLMDSSEPNLELDSPLGVQEYVYLLQIAGAMHDAAEWVSYSKNFVTFLAPAPDKEDLSQFGTVVDTHSLEFAKNYAEMEKIGVKSSDLMMNQLRSTTPFTLSSKKAKTAKVDLDPEYTVLSKDASATPYALNDRPSNVEATHTGTPTTWQRPASQQIDNTEVMSPTAGGLVVFAIVMVIRKGLEILLSNIH